jgi:hypothetical protein
MEIAFFLRSDPIGIPADRHDHLHVMSFIPPPFPTLQTAVAGLHFPSRSTGAMTNPVLNPSPYKFLKYLYK